MTNFAKFAALLFLLPIWSAGANLAPAADRPPRLVELESPLSPAGSQALLGFLRLPDGPSPSPAVVLLHGCGGFWRGIDERWGKLLAEWGYVTLTIDRFGPRGITDGCTGGMPPQTLNDAYRALHFLVGQSSVDAGRVAVVGFSQGGLLALLSVEHGHLERSAAEKFNAAVGFYPPCRWLKGNMTVPTLIMVGELDDWTPAQECRNLVEGGDDWGVSREKGKGVPIELIVYPGAYHNFDIPALATPRQFLGHHLEFNQAALDRSIDALRKFLYATIGNKEKQP